MQAVNNGQPEINPLWRAVARRSWSRQLQIADVRKDIDARFEKNEAQMQSRFDKIDAKFDKLGMQMTIRLGLMVAAAVSIIAAILKM